MVYQYTPENIVSLSLGLFRGALQSELEGFQRKKGRNGRVMKHLLQFS